nr:hypothetical protein CFP56_19929 [Quercus suber]
MELMFYRLYSILLVEAIGLGDFVEGAYSTISKVPFIGSMAPSTLVVKNLSEDVTKHDLEELFSKEGPLDSVDFESSTHGVVKFRMADRDRDRAKEAMDKLNETELKGKPMVITWCEKQCPISNAKFSTQRHMLQMPLNFSTVLKCMA